MNPASLSYRIFPLGDAALTIDFGNCIDEQVNKEVITRFHQLQRQPLPGMIEAIPAYSSLTVHYDILFLAKKAPGEKTIYEWMKQQVEEKMKQPVQFADKGERLVRIPVCYEPEFAMDMEYLSGTKNISAEEIISIHTSTIYKVYMLGFLPGFAYMGEVDEKLAIPRKPHPVSVSAGSVGIAGRQTGIYPLTSPGGWVIVGRTPLRLFDKVKDQPVFLQSGDRIRFYPISTNDYYKFLNTPSLLERDSS